MVNPENIDLQVDSKTHSASGRTYDQRCDFA